VQEGVIQPIGGGTRQVDVRLIAATDSDLESAVARREFREPLLRRFSYEIRVPPLRARRDDIGILFYHLLRERLATMGEARRLSREGGDGGPWVPASYVADLVRHDWPGNVRELANVALAFAVENRDRPRARVSDELRAMLRPRRGPEAEPPRASESSRDLKAPGELQEEDFVLALRAEKWSPERAAKRLGISKSHLYKRAASIGVIRLAKDLSDAEIRAAVESARGDLDEAAERLRVSGRGLRLRLKR
jgi:two-component system nitrogen regulation response regulator GlnG